MARARTLDMSVDLDRRSDVPVGVQLAWHLRSLIVRGELPAGERLPGVRELAAAAGVNANTVRAVYARLDADDLISTEHGRGTFVAADASGDERLAEIVERAAREAQDAGLDLRDVAAGLFVARPEALQRDAVPGGEREERRAVRREIAELEQRRAVRCEIAQLEQRLSDGRLQRLIGAATDEAAPPPAARTATGGRILSLHELSALRDELRGRVALLEGADRSRMREAERRDPATEAQPAATRRSPRPSRLKLTPGPVAWSLRYEG